MTQLETLLDRAERYAEATGLSLSTVSRKIFNDGKRIGRLRAGDGITVARLEGALKQLSEMEREAMTRGRETAS